MASPNDPRQNVSVSALHLLRALSEFADARRGMPTTSHRGGLVGPAVVNAKKVFRRVFQPFVNEALMRQTHFNEHLLDWAHAVHREFRTLESAALAVQSRLDGRVRALEDRIAQLEAEAAKQARSQAGGGNTVSTASSAETSEANGRASRAAP